MSNKSAIAVQRQREYYARTAEHYEAMHIAPDDEHGVALAVFAEFARFRDVGSILDVGAGTGRAIAILANRLPGATVVGIEPVAALRAVGHANGIPSDRLIDGDVLKLPYPDDAFDFVIETGVLHHVPNPADAVSEMVRVARVGVMLSDSNKLGQGSRATRAIKKAIQRLGLWNAMIFLTTGGKMAKWSEGDGVFYSYSVLDNLDELRRKFPRLYLLNTLPLSGNDIRHGAGQICAIALSD